MSGNNVVALFRPDSFEVHVSMSLRALLYRRPTEPQALQVVFDKAIYLVRVRRHRQARRYTPVSYTHLTLPPNREV